MLRLVLRVQVPTLGIGVCRGHEVADDSSLLLIGVLCHDRLELAFP